MGGRGDFVEVKINRDTLPLQAGCAKTYVQLFKTSRNLVWTCNSLTWLVGGTNTFLINEQAQKQMKIDLLMMSKKVRVRTLCANSKKLFGLALSVSYNQILYDDCPKDKWRTKFFSYRT